MFHNENFIIACFIHKFLNNIHYSAELSYRVILPQNYFGVKEANISCKELFKTVLGIVAKWHGSPNHFSITYVSAQMAGL